LLLDEPTAGLDLDGGAALWTELARRAAAGAAAAVATHELAAVERHAARVVILDEGRVAADAPPAELLARLGVSDLAAAYRRVTGRDASALVPRGGIGAGKGGSSGASPAGRNRTAGRG
jgi:ABC-type multidrug transport system ATPase subunit